MRLPGKVLRSWVWMAGLALGLLAPGLAAAQPTAPRGWQIYPQPRTCVLETLALLPGEREPWRVRLGYVQAQPQLFIVTFSHPSLQRSRLPERTRAWLLLDEVGIASQGVSLLQGELIVPMRHNPLLLQRVGQSQALGLLLQPSPLTRRTTLTRLRLGNLTPAVDWVLHCRRVIRHLRDG